MCDIDRLFNTFALLCIPGGRYTYFDLKTNSRGLDFIENKFKTPEIKLNKYFGNSNKTRKEIKVLDARHF